MPVEEGVQAEENKGVVVDVKKTIVMGAEDDMDIAVDDGAVISIVEDGTVVKTCKIAGWW